MNKQQRNILLVEDNIAHATLIKRAFEDANSYWQLQHVKTLKNAKSVLGQQQPNLMILDNKLPDGDGIELLPGSIESRIFPIIMMTAYGDEKVAVSAMKSGASDYVVKSDFMFADMPHIAELTLLEWQHIIDKKHAEAALWQSEHIVSSSADMMAMLDKDFIYLAANPAYLKMFNKTLNDIIDHSMVDIFGKKFFNEIIKPNAKRCLAGEEVTYQMWFDLPNAKNRFMDIHYYPYRLANNEVAGFIINGRDITDLKKAEQQALRKEVQAKRIIETALDAFIQIDSNGLIKEWNPKAEKIFGWKKEEVIGHTLSESIIPPKNQKKHNEGISGYQDAHDSPVINKTIEIEAIHRNGNWIPIELSVVEEREFDGIYFNAFMRDISLKVKSRNELINAHSELMDSLVGTINAISKAVEAKDPYTAGHQRRVADIACAIAREMGLSSDQVQGIFMGGMIHDIGKLQTPSDLLSKPTKLKAIEYRLIQEHAVTGYEILKDIKFPWPVAEIAYQHHERINGTGYPQGLKGEEICLEARIVAVADVVEAISSHRPYRPALGINIAIDEIKAKRGIFYDSEVVDACLKAVEENKIEILPLKR
ncbi:MAG: PAS domain S-box protein [Mariprofundales bacterium]